MIKCVHKSQLFIDSKVLSILYVMYIQNLKLLVARIFVFKVLIGLGLKKLLRIKKVHFSN